MKPISLILALTLVVYTQLFVCVNPNLNSFVVVWKAIYLDFVPTDHFINAVDSISRALWDTTSPSIYRAQEIHVKICQFYSKHSRILQELALVSDWCEIVQAYLEDHRLVAEYTYLLAIHHIYHMPISSINSRPAYHINQLGKLDGSALACILRHTHDWGNFDLSQIIYYVYCIKSLLDTGYYPGSTIQDRIGALKLHIKSMYFVHGPVISHGDSSFLVPNDMIAYASKYLFIRDMGLLVASI
jgi:hypothetical protein